MILPVSKGLTAYNFAWYGGMVVVLALFVYLGIPYGSLSVQANFFPISDLWKSRRKMKYRRG